MVQLVTIENIFIYKKKEKKMYLGYVCTTG